MNEHHEPHAAIDELQEFASWAATNPGFSLNDYAFHYLSADLMVAVTKLFWPDLVHHEGRVFLAERFDVNVFYEWKARLHGDLREVERAMNHRHVTDLFSGASQLSGRNIHYVGEVIKRVWSCRLHRGFPTADFLVLGEYDEAAEDYEVTFFASSWS